GLPPPSGQFLSYEANDNWVVAQTAGGKLWVLDSRTGRRVHALDTAREPWPRPPLDLDGRHFCLVTDPHTVILLDAAQGKELARPSLVAPTTLSGRPPLAVGSGDVLLVVADRNFGLTLQRFDPLTGKALWDDERPLGLGPLAPGGVSFDRDAAYVAVDAYLSAYGLDDGRLLWRVPLPDPGRRWQTAPVGSYLLAYPADIGACGVRVESLIGSVGVLPPRAFSVLLRDPKSGALVERLNLRTRKAAADWGWQPGGPLVPRLAAEAEPLRIQLAPRGLVAAVPGTVWERTSSGPRRPISP
ncbi:MAG TPA: PQQ-binding-like beta-propeller repeat protein, partial [Gemmataceae bacterium]|nr:PQQ-binding-like beta-propeller repeat protein [Gemmataceae bacterium]